MPGTRFVGGGNTLRGVRRQVRGAINTGNTDKAAALAASRPVAAARVQARKDIKLAKGKVAVGQAGSRKALKQVRSQARQSVKAAIQQRRANRRGA